MQTSPDLSMARLPGCCEKFAHLRACSLYVQASSDRIAPAGRFLSRHILETPNFPIRDRIPILGAAVKLTGFAVVGQFEIWDDFPPRPDLCDITSWVRNPTQLIGPRSVSFVLT